MNKEGIQRVLEEIKQQPKRKFLQSYDLIINLNNIQIKQTPVDLFVTMHSPKGKKVSVAAFVDQELAEQAKTHCDLAIREADFPTYADKKKAKKLATQYDYFIAQANLMPKIAATFGKVLGTKGKMPNPKLGCVVPPNADLQSLLKKLQSTVRLVAKKGTNLQCLIGKEDMPDEQIIDNILTVYQAVLKQLPGEINNIKNVSLKLSMGAPVRIAH